MLFAPGAMSVMEGNASYLEIHVLNAWNQVCQSPSTLAIGPLFLPLKVG